MVDPEGLAGVISNALKKEGLGRQKQVIASLPGLHSLTRIVELPLTRELRPELAIPQMARREMGFSPESNFIFWRPVGVSRLRRRFFVFTAPKEPAATLVETLKLAGLRPVQIETKPFALARAVNQPEAMVVDLESNGLDIVVVRAGLPVVTQSAFLGEEAQEGEALLAIVRDTLDRVVSSYNDGNPDNPLPPGLPYYLVGASFSLNPDLAEALAGVLGHPPSQFTPPLLHPADFP
ncbi:MAG: hypothetical protein Q8O76_05625, partial [Chloroflexota bacterium]|nr:hypothetical protein [Chloroflexota bacterium]